MVLEVPTGMGILHQAPKPKALFFLQNLLAPVRVSFSRGLI